MDSITNMKIIEEMLYTAKKEVKDNGFFFMLWGWLVFVAAMGEVVLSWLKMDSMAFSPFKGLNVELHGITWLILMPLGGIISIIISRKQNNEEKVRTWFDDVMKYLWIAFGSVLGIILFMMSYASINLFPIIIALYGLGLFITGGVLKFNPLVFGGIASWILAVAAILVSGVYITLLLAIAVFIGYIIPGHILQKQWKENV